MAPSPNAASSPDPARLPAGLDVPDLPDHVNYLVIEGVIGAGKTTLAEMLGRVLEANVVREQFEENPFLERFYDDRDRWAFQTQLAFLASRFRQQKDLGTRDLFHQVVISDYSFDKDRIFAHETLSGDELQLYEALYQIMEPNTPDPDLVVYLQSPVDRLMANIRKRDREYERGIDRDYIASLQEAYETYFRHYRKSPLLVVRTDGLDFVENDDHFEAIVRHITTAEATGREVVGPV
jgi:deoxyadenosine/deoxycytidine kinase